MSSLHPPVSVSPSPSPPPVATTKGVRQATLLHVLDDARWAQYRDPSAPTPLPAAAAAAAAASPSSPGSEASEPFAADGRSYDFLGLNLVGAVRAMLFKRAQAAAAATASSGGAAPFVGAELAIFSDLVLHSGGGNSNSAPEPAALLLTARALYFLSPFDFLQCTKRVALESLGRVEAPEASGGGAPELVLRAADGRSAISIHTHRRALLQRLMKQRMEKATHPAAGTADSAAAAPATPTAATATAQPAGDAYQNGTSADAAAAADSAPAASEVPASGPPLPPMTAGNSAAKPPALSDFELVRTLYTAHGCTTALVQRVSDGRVFTLRMHRKSSANWEHVRMERVLSEWASQDPTLAPWINPLEAAFHTRTHWCLLLSRPLHAGTCDLATALTTSKRLSVDAVRAIAAQLTHLLGQAHARGLSNLPVCPSNLYVDVDAASAGEFSLFVGELGLAQWSGAAHSPRPQVLPVSPYLSPDAITLNELSTDPVSDWWTLGVLLYELSAGMRPFNAKAGGAGGDAASGDLLQQIHFAVLRYPPFVAQPPQRKQLLQGLLVRDRAKRVQDAEQAKQMPFLSEVDWDVIKGRKGPVPQDLQGLAPNVPKQVQTQKGGLAALDSAPQAVAATTASGNEGGAAAGAEVEAAWNYVQPAAAEA